MHFDGLEGAPLLGRLEGSAGAEISDPGSGVHTEKQASGCNFQMDGSSIFLIRISKNHDFFKFTNFGKPKKNDTKLEISCS